MLTCLWAKIKLVSSRLVFKQELMYIWNGFKVLNHRPDLVQPLMKLVENSLHKLRQTKGKWFNLCVFSTNTVKLLSKLTPDSYGRVSAFSFRVDVIYILVSPRLNWTVRNVKVPVLGPCTTERFDFIEVIWRIKTPESNVKSATKPKALKGYEAKARSLVRQFQNMF